jgi:hypothetical protein
LLLLLQSPYIDVMKSAWDKGVLSVKSAGNSGTGGVFYEADVALAVGSIVVGSIGAEFVDLDEVVEVSQFSSFGPVSSWDWRTPCLCFCVTIKQQQQQTQP